MDTNREDELNELFRHARQAVPVYDSAQQFESVMRRRNEPEEVKEVSYRQLKLFAATACAVLLINIAIWTLSRRSEQRAQPSGLQSFNLNIY